jgi:hypothetical protein
VQVAAAADVVGVGLRRERREQAVRVSTTPRTVSRSCSCRSAAASASARVIEISCWPGPYSLIACSTWMPWASSASTMSLTTRAARSSPAEE